MAALFWVMTEKVTQTVRTTHATVFLVMQMYLFRESHAVVCVFGQASLSRKHLLEAVLVWIVVSVVAETLAFFALSPVFELSDVGMRVQSHFGGILWTGTLSWAFWILYALYRYTMASSRMRVSTVWYVVYLLAAEALTVAGSSYSLSREGGLEGETSAWLYFAGVCVVMVATPCVLFHAMRRDTDYWRGARFVQDKMPNMYRSVVVTCARVCVCMFIYTLCVCVRVCEQEIDGGPQHAADHG
jgi:hypothetical protein